MTWTITGDSAHDPELITDYSSGQASLNSVDTLLDSSLSVQLRDAATGTGRFRALFLVLSDAIACREDIAKGHVLTVADDEDPDLDMSFVLADGGVAAIEANTDAGVWFVTCDFQEVPA